MLDNKAIETLSINAVRNSIVVSGYLDQFIPDNDKEPSWDVHVYVYNDKNKKKANIRGRVPVQIKGTAEDDFSKDEISFPVSTVDLKNYLYDGGAVFFVVYIGHSGLCTQIYYEELPPMKLRFYLANSKNQETKNIKLKKFPSDPNEKLMIFYQCLQNCQRQKSFACEKLLSLEELEELGVLEGIEIPVSTPFGVDPKKALFANEVYIYAKIKGSSILQPLQGIPQNIATKETKSIDISVAGKLFYNEVTVVEDAETVKAYIGKSFCVTTDKTNHSINVKYENSDSVRTLAVDLDFMLSFIENGSFQLNQSDFQMDKSTEKRTNFSVEEQKERLKYTKKTVQLLDLFGCKKDISLKSLNDEDLRYLDYLITAFVDKEPINNLIGEVPPILFLNVGDLKFAVCMQKVDDSTDSYMIYDFFKTEMALCYENKNGETLPISQFSILHADDLLKLDNIRFDALLPSFQETEKHSETYINANMFLLELLKAYDIDATKPELLSTAKEFADWIFKSADGSLAFDVKLLNKLQTVKRIRPLNIWEIKELFKIVNDPNRPNYILVGAYLLLDQQAEARAHFEKLDSQYQEEFKTYPIYHFWESSEET